MKLVERLEGETNLTFRTLSKCWNMIKEQIMYKVFATGVQPLHLF